MALAFFNANALRAPTADVLNVPNAKCQIFGTFSTPNTKTEVYQMFQMVKIIPHMNSTVANLQRYGQMW